MEISAVKIAGSNLVCEKKLSLDEAREIMFAHLKEKGYSW
jgi:hypothetical protein